jgi:hypothetical protein
VASGLPGAGREGSAPVTRERVVTILADVSASMLFRHFSSREALVLTDLQRATGQRQW